MMPKSGQCRAAADRITAASIIQGIGLQKYERNFRISLVFFSAISFGPYWIKRFCASAWVNPSGADPSFVCNADIGSDFRSSWVSGFDFGCDMGLSGLDFTRTAASPLC